MSSESRIARGMLRSGSSTSSATLIMSSKPMNAKNASAPPCAMLHQVGGGAGAASCAGSAVPVLARKTAPTTTTISKPASSIVVARMLAADDSRSPRKLMNANKARMATTTKNDGTPGTIPVRYPAKANDIVASDKTPEHKTTHPTPSAKRLLPNACSANHDSPALFGKRPPSSA